MIGKPEDIIRWLFSQDREKSFEIKEVKKKRSLNANNYAWELITKIANELRTSKEEVYMKMLEDYGQSQMISVIANADIRSYYKYCKKVGSSMLNGKDFSHYKIYKGTSEYDTKEMSIFIDGLVQEAQNLGIETRTPSELQRLKEMWKNER